MTILDRPFLLTLGAAGKGHFKLNKVGGDLILEGPRKDLRIKMGLVGDF